MILELLQKINDINEFVFSPIDGWIEGFSAADWVKDAIIDSLHMLPFLLFIFFAIAVLEYFYSDKADTLAARSARSGPLIGSLLATIPQCGFSVIASTLYAKKIITVGTLLAVYLATSDEALPVLLAEPEKYHLVLPLLGVKIVIALIAGYGIDLAFRLLKKKQEVVEADKTELEHDKHDHEGCCHHKIHSGGKLSLWLHPIVHTINIFVFILIVTLVINYAVDCLGGEEHLGEYLLNNSPLQPVLTGFFGLVPNCAVSIAITLMYMKGAIGFGSCVSGLCSSAGLGLLVLLKKNENKKDTLFVVLVLLGISIVSGLLCQIFWG